MELKIKKYKYVDVTTIFNKKENLAKIYHRRGYIPVVEYVGRFKIFGWFLETFYFRLYYYYYTRGYI